MQFEYLPLTFRMTAVDTLRFAPLRAGNAVRGVLGAGLRRVAPEAYQRLFRADNAAPVPSGLHDRPRPFVLRVRHLDGKTIPAGEAFTICVNVFELREPWEELLGGALGDRTAACFGLGRGRAELTAVESPAGPVTVPLTATGEMVDEATIHYFTPTELKPVSKPDFAIVAARARDRVSNLTSLYGGGTPEFDFVGLGRRAAAVEMVEDCTRIVDLERTSGATGQRHSIGGFVGCARYRGPISEFLPILRAAAHTGIGRHTVWGNGEIQVDNLKAAAPSPDGAA